MWAMSPHQPYITQGSTEEDIPVGRAKVKSPNGTTNFNVYLSSPPQQNSVPQQQQQQPQMHMPFSPWSTPPVINVQTPPQMYPTPQIYPSPQMYPFPQMYPYQPLGMQQQPTLIFLPQQTQPEKKKEEEKPKPEKPKEEKPKEEKPKEEKPKEEKPKEKKPGREDITAVCIASIIIFCIGLVLGVVCISHTVQAYEAHLDYEESGNGLRSGPLFDEWQMTRNISLGTGASAIVCFSLAILLVFWSGMHHKMSRRVKPGFCMMAFLITGLIVFALSFLIDVIILVLAFDSDNIIYPELVWGALIGNVISWLFLLGHSEMARREL